MKRIRKYSGAEKFGYQRIATSGRASVWQALHELKSCVEFLSRENSVAMSALSDLGLVRTLPASIRDRLQRRSRYRGP